jgi:predicted nucleic acid-binding protein
MNVVDSSAWLEYFADGPAAGFFAPAIEDTGKLLVPTVSLYEVFKRMMQQVGENAALNAVAIMQKGEVVDFTAPLALSAVNLSVKHKLPMADGVMYATARAFDATFWTQDADFENLPHVRYRRAGSGR